MTSRPVRPLPRALLAALLAALVSAGPALADPTAGRWVANRVEGRPGASAVTLVGTEGIAANRVAVYCDAYGAVAVSLARRPGLPAAVPVGATLVTDAGSTGLSGVTNRYGVLVVHGAPAREAARLLAAARRDARALLDTAPGFGPISVVGSTKAIGRVLKRCGG